MVEESSMSLFIIAVTICALLTLAHVLDKPIKRLLEK